MKTTKYSVIAAAALMLAGSGALTHQRLSSKPARRTSRASVPTSSRAEAENADCVKARFGELSAPCEDVVTKVAAIGKACKADVKQFCADVKPGGGRIETCMKARLDEVSDPCKDASGQQPNGWQELKMENGHFKDTMPLQSFDCSGRACIAATVSVSNN